MNSTISYYNENAGDFIAGTLDVDFTAVQDEFLRYLKPGALILDLGCGSGRDTKYFLDKGFRVEAVDGSEAICRQASAFTGINVKQMYFQDLDAYECYDGIWACASILHLQKQELPDVFRRIQNALRENGILYVSFKYGDFEGDRNGRYFTDLTEESAASLIKQCKQLSVIKMCVTGDVRPGRGDEQWLNVLLKKDRC